jgi:hypothetical protein
MNTHGYSMLFMTALLLASAFVNLHSLNLVSECMQDHAVSILFTTNDDNA